MESMVVFLVGGSAEQAHDVAQMRHDMIANRLMMVGKSENRCIMIVIRLR